MSTTTETDAVLAAELESWDIRSFYRWATAMKGEDYAYDDSGSVISDVHRYWHQVMQGRYALHPCIALMLKYKPKDYKQLCMEWGHVADSDDTRIAYTRSDADGTNDRQLVTSVGKYLSRHWPHVPDHVRRDAQAGYTPDRRIIVHTIPDFVMTVELGPRSCMASIYGSVLFRHSTDHQQMLKWMKDPEKHSAPDWERHPYACYKPELGWSMAQRWARIDGEDRLDGRALIYTSAKLPKPQFVRTYKRNLKDPQNGWSETDFALQAWLEQNGCEKVDNWPAGAQLQSAPGRNDAEMRLPYVDGTRRWFEIDPVSQIASLIMTPSLGSELVGMYGADNTTGSICPYGISVSGRSNNGQTLEDYAYDNDYDTDDVRQCEDCGAFHHEDDSYSVERNEDRRVCPNCIDNYTQVRGSSRHGGYYTYYLSDNYAEVDGGDFYIDQDHVPEGIVCLDDGDYVTEDHATFVPSRGAWYRNEDTVIDANGEEQHVDDCVYTEDGEWVLSEDAYESEVDANFHFSTKEARDDYDAERRGDDEEEEEQVTTVSAVSDEKFSLAA